MNFFLYNFEQLNVKIEPLFVYFFDSLLRTTADWQLQNRNKRMRFMFYPLHCPEAIFTYRRHSGGNQWPGFSLVRLYVTCLMLMQTCLVNKMIDILAFSQLQKKKNLLRYDL